MVNYGNSVIYKLCCKDVSIKEIYIGSTTNFSRRKSAHKSYCTNINSVKYNLNVYKFIRANGDWDNWDMIEIEKYQSTDKKDLERRERYFIETLGSSLNSYTPSGIIIETIAKYKKDHREANIDQYKERGKIHYIENKELYQERAKIRYEKNKVLIAEQYEKNKVLIAEQAKIRYEKKKVWKTIYDFIYS